MKYTFSDKIANLKPSAIREILKAPSSPTTISFAAGNPSPESFPVEELARLSADIYRDSSTAALQYSVTDGYTPLREAVAKRQRDVWGIGKIKEDNAGYTDDTIIVSGGTQGIELTCKILCNEGDAVICENPTFIGALNAFRSSGAQTVGVPLLDTGIDTDALESVLKTTPRAKFMYVIPTFQNPAGITWNLSTRKKVMELAHKYDILILEDNPYGELRFAGEDLPTLKSMDTDGRVIYCSSFSKILSAGMRVGFIVAPSDITSKIVVAKQVEDVHTNIFFQMLCYRYMNKCDLQAHIMKIKDIYRHKCTLMLDCLDKCMPREITYTRPEGGLFIWCTLPDYVDSGKFLRACVDADVRVVPGATFNCDADAPSQSFRLNYSTPSDEQIEKGIAILGDIAQKFL